MKKLMGLMGLMSGLVVISSGCTTTTVVTPAGATNSVQVLKPGVAEAIQGVVAIATPIAVQEDMNARPYLVLVSEVFSAAAAAGQYDPAAVQAALDTVSVRELRESSAAKQVVLTAMAAYRGLAADAVNQKLDAATWGPVAKQVLMAISEGIKSGLN